jgi:hypothetical protein
MARFDAALQRFSAALDALETRSGRYSGPARRDGGDEMMELRLERDRLMARIASLEKESASLAGITEAVETRLDGAIAEIRAALGRS